jgi:hypothetical protein
VRSIDKELILRAGFERAEAADRRHAYRLQVLPLIADYHADIGRDALRQIDLIVGLARAVGPGRVDRNLWQRDFVGDERVVGQDRRREKALPGPAVRQRGGIRGQKNRGGGKNRARPKGFHVIAPAGNADGPRPRLRRPGIAKDQTGSDCRRGARAIAGGSADRFDFGCG